MSHCLDVGSSSGIAVRKRPGQHGNFTTYWSSISPPNRQFCCTVHGPLPDAFQHVRIDVGGDRNSGSLPPESATCSESDMRNLDPSEHDKRIAAK